MNTSILIDTETLGLSPSAIITEIAVIAFIIEPQGNPVVIDHRVIRPDFWEQLAAGRTCDADTIAFHRRNGTLPILSNIEHPIPDYEAVPCIEAITEITAFIRLHQPKHVWIQGTDFDRPLIENLCGAHNQPLPWKYSISRDARTAWSIAFPGEKHPKRPHKALEDCQATLADLTSALTKLNALSSI